MELSVSAEPLSVCHPLFLRGVRSSTRVAAALSVTAAGAAELDRYCCGGVVPFRPSCGVQALPVSRGRLHAEVIARADKTRSPAATSPTPPCAVSAKRTTFQSGEGWGWGGWGGLNPEDCVGARRRIWILSTDRAKSPPRSAFWPGAAHFPPQVNSISLHVFSPRLNLEIMR